MAPKQKGRRAAKVASADGAPRSAKSLAASKMIECPILASLLGGGGVLVAASSSSTQPPLSVQLDGGDGGIETGEAEPLPSTLPSGAESDAAAWGASLSGEAPEEAFDGECVPAAEDDNFDDDLLQELSDALGLDTPLPQEDISGKRQRRDCHDGGLPADPVIDITSEHVTPEIDPDSEEDLHPRFETLPDVIVDPLKVLASAELVDGVGLNHLHITVLKLLGKLTFEQRRNLHQKLLHRTRFTTASLCSGSSMDHIVAETVFNVVAPHVKVSCAYTCECIPKKQDFLMNVVHPADFGSTACCCFKDVTAMNGLQAPCARHNGECTIPSDGDGPDVLAAGFSCKNFSRLFQNRGAFTNCIAQSVGSSGTTAQGTADHVGTHTPPIVVLENVAELLEALNVENLKALVAELSRHGYALKAMQFDACQNGYPTRRKRCYFVAIHMERFGLDAVQAEQCLREAFALMTQMDLSHDMHSLESLLFGSDAPEVQSALFVMLDGKGNENSSAAWPVKHKQLLSEQSVAWSRCVPPPEVRASSFYEVLCGRERHVLGYKLQSTRDVSTVDLYPTIDRHSENTQGTSDETGVICSTILPGTKLWLVKQNRLAIGEEHLNIQGMPTCVLKRTALAATSNATLADLAGNAFNGGTYATVFLSVLLALPLLDHARNDREHAAHDLGDMMEFLQTVMSD
jgi:hypothetical protein